MTRPGQWIGSFVLLLLCGPFRAAFAEFDDTGAGARAAALGDAYAALGDDAASLMYNPAGLARVKYSEITSEYSRFYPGLTDGSNLGQYFLGYAVPLKQIGTLGLAWKQFSLDSFYTERTLSLGYGRWITPYWAAGVAVKQLYHSFDSPSIVVDDAGNIQPGTPALFAQNGTSRSAYSADFGMLYRLTPRHVLGFSVQDLNQPNVALSPSDTDDVPRTVRLALAYQRPKKLSFTGALSARENIPGQEDYKGTGAVEKWWTLPTDGEWAARGALVAGSRDLRQASIGFGMRFARWSLDYAFLLSLSGPSVEDTGGTHRFSLTYRLGGKKERGNLKILQPGQDALLPALPDETAGNLPAVLSVSTSAVGGFMLENSTTSLRRVP